MTIYDGGVAEGATMFLADTSFRGNVGADGVVGAYDDASLVLEGVDFADNAPCDVVAGGTCLTDLGADVDLACGAGGCAR